MIQKIVNRFQLEITKYAILVEYSGNIGREAYALNLCLFILVLFFIKLLGDNFPAINRIGNIFLLLIISDNSSVLSPNDKYKQEQKLNVQLTNLFQLNIIVLYNSRYTKQHYEEFVAMCKFIGEKNMRIQQKMDLFNIISVKIEKDKDEQNINIYRQYTQHGCQPLQKYFQMIYLAYLQNQQIFSAHFTNTTLLNICNIIQEQFFSDNQVIYDELNDEEISLFMIVEGEVSISLTNQSEQIDMKDQSSARLTKDSIIGYTSFFTGIRQNFIYRAHDRVRLLRIPKDAFMQILGKDSDIDFQKFCEIKDRLLFERNDIMNENHSSIHSKKNIQQLCWACQSTNHDISVCDKCHFVVNRLNFAIDKQGEQSHFQERKFCKRQKNKKIPVFQVFHKLQLSFNRFQLKNKSFMNVFEKKYLVQNQSENSKSFFATSENLIPSQPSKLQTIQNIQESHKSTSNKFMTVHNNNINNNNPSPNVTAKERSFLIQSLMNVQMQDSNKSHATDNQAKTISSIPPKHPPHQIVIQEETQQTIQSSKRNTLAQLYPEKIQSDLNHGINLNNNTIPSIPNKQKKCRKYDDIFDDNQGKGESPLNSQPNVSRLSNIFTPSSKQNAIVNQNNYGDFKAYLSQLQQKNDVIILQVEENQSPNLFEFNLNKPIENHNEYFINVQYKNSNADIQNRSNYKKGGVPHLKSNQNFSQKYIQNCSDSIQDCSNENTNNYNESTAFNFIKSYQMCDIDKMFITQNYFIDYNIDTILKYIKKYKQHQNNSKHILQKVNMIDDYNRQALTFNIGTVGSPKPFRKKIENNQQSLQNNKVE